MSARAELAEKPVRLTELAFMPLLVAPLARQHGELDMDQRLARPCASPTCKPERPREFRLALRACTRPAQGRKHSRRSQARKYLEGTVRTRLGELGPFAEEV